MLGKKPRILIILPIIILISLVGVVLFLLFEYLYPFMYNLLYEMSSFPFLIFIDLIIAEIFLIIFIYHLINPIKTSKGKTILSVFEMILGAVMTMFPLFFISLMFPTFYAYFLEGFLFVAILGLLIYCFFLIPGVFLIWYGWQYRKLIINENSSHSKNDYQ